MRDPKLSASMTLTQFDHGYWYATELKQFATRLGIPSTARMRKDELEGAIKQFLRTGTTARSATRHPSTPHASKERDVDLGLHLKRRVIRYTNDRVTKEFLEDEARKLVAGLRRRSGARYRLNRWREEQLRRGVKLTYGDLVKEYVRLSQSTEPFARIPHTRYVNFISDFLSAQPGATRGRAITAWRMLKTLDCPKTYHAWVKAQRQTG